MKKQKLQKLLNAKPKNRFVRVLKYAGLGLLGALIHAVGYSVFILDRFICAPTWITKVSYKTWITVDEWIGYSSIRVAGLLLVLWIFW